MRILGPDQRDPRVWTPFRGPRLAAPPRSLQRDWGGRGKPAGLEVRLQLIKTEARALRCGLIPALRCPPARKSPSTGPEAETGAGVGGDEKPPRTWAPSSLGFSILAPRRPRSGRRLRDVDQLRD